MTGIAELHAQALNPVGLAALRDQLDTYWQRALAGYTEAAEAPDEEG
jgi:hypothetical protein